MKRILIFLAIAVLTTSCANQPAVSVSETDEARAALVNFFELMSDEKYSKADALYGGSYETLLDWNPDIDPNDQVGLWTRGCEQNGLKCLSARSITLQEQQGDTYIFQVEFSNPDGSLFVRGPCCGASETDMPPESQFDYKVLKTAEGNFLVMDMPPYVP